MTYSRSIARFRRLAPRVPSSREHPGTTSCGCRAGLAGTEFGTLAAASRQSREGCQRDSEPARWDSPAWLESAVRRRRGS
jgi:hypothetical protein